MNNKYGFHLERDSSGTSVDTLVTGDGKSAFSDITYSDGDVGIGFSYGNGGGLGTTKTHDKGTSSADLEFKWQVRFERIESIDAMIDILNLIRERLAKDEDKS